MNAKSNLFAPTLIACIAVSIWTNPSLAQSSDSPTLAHTKITNKHTEISIGNFKKVTPNIWRGAVPKGDLSFRQLKQMGVKSIVNLRMSGSGQKKERLFAEKYGIKYFHEPIGYFKPSNQKVARLLQLITKRENQPVFVHCMQGADRTGMVIGMYRRLFQDWTYDRAYAEMKIHHFKPWFLGLKAKVKESSSNKPLIAVKDNILFNAKSNSKQALAGISKSELSM